MLQDQSRRSLWTDEIDETVRTNRALGVSATDCSSLVYKQYGVMLTRNAIIGRATREGWPTLIKPGSARRTIRSAGAPVKSANAAKQKHTDHPDRIWRDRYARPDRVWPDLPKIPIVSRTDLSADLSDAPASRSVPLLDLAVADCRFPTGESADVGRYLFCGQPQQDGSPYCGFHHGVCNRTRA